MKIKRTEVLHVDEFDNVRVVNMEKQDCDKLGVGNPVLCLKVKGNGADLSVAEVTTLRDEFTAWLDTGHFTPDDEPEPEEPAP
jgi:hypothetical protein